MPRRDAPSLVEAALALLDRTASTIEQLPGDAYSKAAPGCDNATIGQHVRHLVDHYEALVCGYETERVVSYDRRERGGTVETDTGAALDAIRSLRERLDGLDDVQLSFDVTIRVLPAPDAEEIELPSMFSRELAFVTHHGVHHHALIKLVARDLGVELDSTFGRAPSTVKAESGT
ncbi:MAG: hypothetical protein CMJ31_01410 [Phycisphaerae bacterium]|nr:hypothetical protein [Phycisphaerae bacterium]|tara:strand:- start:17 stop:541 length:525 start_codon:yes stop_codon:yes gene_type:complete